MGFNSEKKINATKPVQTNKNVEHNIFKVGERVIHPTFGEGIVILKKEMSSDTLYEISFDLVGTKKLMGSYAKLKKK